MRVTIEKLDYDGRGLTHIDGVVTFIPKVLPNEEISCTITDRKNHLYFAKCNKVFTKSPLRIRSKCPFSKRCGGCMYDHLTYEEGLKEKETKLKEYFTQNGYSFSNFKILANINPYGYRNKITLKVSNGKLGYYEEASHEFIPITKCLLAKDSLNEIITHFSYFAFLNGELMIRTNKNNEILLSIQTEEPIKIQNELFTQHKIAGILYNDKPIYLDTFFFEREDNILYQVSYDSFFQVNEWMRSILSNELLRSITKTDIVLDLYCGVGYLSLKMAKKAQEVVGVEIVPNAIKNALKNKKLNACENVSFHLGNVMTVLPKLPMKFTVIVVDPPRSGLDKKSATWLNTSQVPKIIYVSCNPKTLIRDLSRLSNYEVEELKGYDMFSYTKHVECLCVLKLR